MPIRGRGLLISRPINLKHHESSSLLVFQALRKAAETRASYVVLLLALFLPRMYETVRGSGTSTGTTTSSADKLGSGGDALNV